MDYPTPILVNWGGKVDSNNRFATHLAKINSILEYLRGLPASNDKDLILIVDGYDVWFQLRPEVLIRRYYDTIARSNERLATKFDPEVINQHGFTQTVIFGADKKCWPQDMDGLICNVLPESSLPKTAFGSQTDNGEPRYARPRWVNSGTVLGPVADVRAIFEAASQRVKDKFHGWSDQYYFAEIFGEQELRRNSLAIKPQNLEKYLIKDERKDSFKNIQQDPKAEFHISMDYEASLFHTNTFATNDTEWVVFNTSSVSTDPSAVIGDEASVDPRLPNDIVTSRPPIFDGVVSERLLGDETTFAELPFDTTWSNVPLLFNKITGHIPVVLHINGDKSLLNKWWGELWWAQGKWGKQLLQSSSRAPRGPLTSLYDEETGQMITWWKGSYNSLNIQNGGYWTSGGRWVDYDDACGKHADVLFEGKPTSAFLSKPKGGWLGPRPHGHKRRDTK